MNKSTTVTYCLSENNFCRGIIRLLHRHRSVGDADRVSHHKSRGKGSSHKARNSNSSNKGDQGKFMSISSPSNMTVYTHAVKLSYHNSSYDATSSEQSFSKDFDKLLLQDDRSYSESINGGRHRLEFVDQERSHSQDRDRSRDSGGRGQSPVQK